MKLAGIVKLREYLKKRDLSIGAFAREHKLDSSEISKLLGGKRQRVSVETAAKIERATEGRVQWHLWVPGGYAPLHRDGAS